jgi:nucleotide-binding universal stress UspA family protein
MEKVLIAVDETQGSRATIPAFQNLIRKPRMVILVNVQRLEGDSLVIDMLGEPELSTLRESLEGTEHKEALDGRAKNILAFYAQQLLNDGVIVKTVIRDGPPAEEILKVAREEAVDLIITGQNCGNFFMRLIKGSVSREIRKNGLVPFLVAKQDEMCREQSPGRGSRAWEEIGNRKWQPALAKPLRI